MAVLIVFMHAFTCFQGAWPPPEGFVEVPFYKWIAQTSFAFTLEAFVLVSGYLYSFTRNYLKRKEGFWTLTKNKLKRLILPSIVFGTAYYLIFLSHNGIVDAIYCILNGCGHMWFLPMLFWCFLGTWLIEMINISYLWKLLFLFLLHIVAVIPLPLHLDAACSFLFYFYLGYVLFYKRETIIEKLNVRNIILAWLFFLIVFFLLRPLKDSFTVGDNATLFYKGLTSMGQNFIQIVYSSIGAFAFYVSAYYYTHHRTLKAGTVQFAGCCFGIYLFQQFVLQCLYYRTSLPEVLGPYLLPWVGFLLALPLSYSFSLLLLKTKTGKFLIG